VDVLERSANGADVGEVMTRVLLARHPRRAELRMYAMSRALCFARRRAHARICARMRASARACKRRECARARAPLPCMRGERATAFDLRPAPPMVRHDRSESSSTGENADEDTDQAETPANANTPPEIGRRGARSRDEEERGARGIDRKGSRGDEHGSSRGNERGDSGGEERRGSRSDKSSSSRNDKRVEERTGERDDQRESKHDDKREGQRDGTRDDQREGERDRSRADADGSRKAARGESRDDEQQDVDADTESRDGERAKRRWYKHPWLVGALIAVVIGIAVGGVLVWIHSRNYQTTDDAFIDVVSQHVSPQISGRVLRVLVNDNQDVSAGDVLVEIDPADYRARASQALAARGQADAQSAEARTQQSIARAQLEQAKADVVMSEAVAGNAASELRRYEKLHEANAGAASRQQLDNADASARSSAAQLESARRKVDAAQARLDATKSEIEAAQATVESAIAAVEQAELNLSYTHVKAELAGRIARKTVAEGNYVSPGTELMAVVPRAVYVTANFKEPQLEHMRAGQKVDIHVDAYPELALTGRVDSLQPGTGQAFSLLPAENATGNWVKVVQRVPVKVVLDEIPDDPRRLAPGMSVEVKVRVR
jgi:membrane fusion protein (multidrug efflux system)